MNILNKISVKNLKLNRKRTISTIIGIILSVALICAVSSLGISFQATLVENAINETGYYHINLINVNDNQIKDIENNRDIKDIYKVKRCGYAKLENSKNEDKPYVKLFSMDNRTFDNLSLKLIEGRYPTNSNEIVISNAIAKDAKVDYKIGDTIKLNVGQRKTSDDYDLDSKNPYNIEDEQIINTREHTFKIVGIIKKPDVSFEGYSEPGYTAISIGINEGQKDLYVSLKNPKQFKTDIPELLGIKKYDDLNVIKGEQGKYEDYIINSELLRWEAFAFSDSTVNMLYSVIGVVIFVIIFTSIFCIRNSFAIATTEKTKMYSMLASIGTTKKQIRKNVITEGLLLGVIGIPLGILSGLFAVFVLLQIVNKLLGEYLLAHVDGLVFKISYLPILLSIVLGIVTIYLSARSSSKRASKVSPIEGLRSSNDIKIKKNKLKVPKIISKVFKTGGVLAYKNLKRSKKKYKATVISISVSIFIFITMNAFITNMFGLTNTYYEDYNYNLLIRGDLNNDEINKIVSHESVQSYSTLYETKDYLKIKDLSKINENSSSLDDDQYREKIKIVSDENEEKYAALQIVALDSKSFQNYVKKIGMNYKDVEKDGILCDESQVFDSNTQKTRSVRRYNYKKGDIVKGESNNKKLEIKIGEISKTKPDGIEKTYYEDGFLIINKEQYKNLDFYLENITIQSKDASKMQKDIENIVDSNNIYNIDEAAKEEKAMVLVIKIFLYGFISVITLIGVTNIFNTITSNMELRQKEFAMLKSIGMTKKEFNRMINLETIFYGTKSWIYGTIMGLLGTFAMYKAFSVKIDEGIYIPINAIIICAIFVFLFVFIIMKYSISKINKQNTIETIRKENI